MNHEYGILNLFFPLMAIYFFLLWALGGEKRNKEPERKSSVSGPGIEREIVRQVIETVSGERITVGGFERYVGVDDSGQIVNETVDVSVELHCGHSKNGYGGKCSCGKSFCSPPSCSWQCSLCGSVYCMRHQRDEKGRCRRCSA